MYRYFSLFSGIGGFECGIGSRAVCIGYSEVDRHALHIYRRHFPQHRSYGDVTRITELPAFDLLVGGFPCQAFSIAGARGGFDDARGMLFFEIVRILKHAQPNILLLENVARLLSHDTGATFAAVIGSLDELGYDLQWQVLNSANFGVPQNRERVFIVGHLRGSPDRRVFPLCEEGAVLSQHNIRERVAHRHKRLWCLGSSPRERREALRGYTIRNLTPTECERLQGFPDGWTEGISERQRYRCLGNAVTVNVIDAIAKRLLGPI